MSPGNRLDLSQSPLFVQHSAEMCSFIISAVWCSKTTLPEELFADEVTPVLADLPRSTRVTYVGALERNLQQISFILHNSDTGWRRGMVVSGIRRMNEVNARRARLVPGWVTVFGRVYHIGM